MMTHRKGGNTCKLYVWQRSSTPDSWKTFTISPTSFPTWLRLEVSEKREPELKIISIRLAHRQACGAFSWFNDWCGEGQARPLWACKTAGCAHSQAHSSGLGASRSLPWAPALTLSVMEWEWPEHCTNPSHPQAAFGYGVLSQQWES